MRTLFVKTIYVAVSLIVILFLSGTVPTTNADTNIATRLTLDPVFSRVAPGDKVVFTGTLRTATGEGLFNMPIRIVEERPPESILLTTAWTNEEGVYEASWVAELINPSGNDRSMTIFAIFDARDQYYGSKDKFYGSKSTTAVRLEINPKLMKVGFYPDSNRYFAGQISKLTIVFFDRIDLIDPDNITVTHDGIKVNITKQRRGIYTYTTTALEPKLHTLRIIAEKEGYDRVERSGLYRVSADSDDRTAPTSSVVINGLYNNETNWYYSKFPIATFNATDHHDTGTPSGVRHIIVKYHDEGGIPCVRNVCSIQPGGNMTLSHYNGVDRGRMDLTWFAQDNIGNIETPNKTSIYVDTQPPKISALSISTENQENVITGSSCNKYKVEERDRQCIIIRAFPNEMITFRILADDLISGLKSVYYREGPRLTALDTDWQILETGSMPFSHYISLKIPHIGAYKLQIKAEDIAGNKSTVKEFVMFITEPLLREFRLSITDFDVQRRVGTEISRYYDISALIKNDAEERITADIILLMVRKDGVTSHIEIMSMQIESYGELDLKRRLILEEVDIYSIKMFILSKGGIPLASPALYILSIQS